MKKHTIFLASSAELDEDKQEFELYINNKNKDLYHHRIFLELITWKDFISSMQVGRTQDEYNRLIRSSDICIFLFHTKIGRYTREEFDNAHEAFLQSKGKVKKPNIYTYFKNTLNEIPEITAFRKHIDSYDHFFDTYSTLDDLIIKFNRQLDKLENEEKVLKPEKIDVPKIIKYAVFYFILPLLVISGAIAVRYYFQPTQMTVKLNEINSVPNLPFKKGIVSLSYGDKTEQLEISNEVIFKQIPSKFKYKNLKLKFSSFGYAPVDTIIVAKDFIELNIKRDNTFRIISGEVINEEGEPIEKAKVNILDIVQETDANGLFRIIIPWYLQSETYRVKIFKDRYTIWDHEGISPANKEKGIYMLVEK